MTRSPLRSLLEEYRRGELAERDAGVDAAGGATVPSPDEQWPLEYLPYGATEERPEALCEVLGTLGSVETEYASIRRAAGVMDCPHLATLELRGSDVRAFLDRLVTAKLEGMTCGDACTAFMLNRKGRIEADLLVADLGDRLVVTLDVAQAAATARALEGFVFTEDVSIRDCTDQVHQLAVHGRAAEDVVAAAAGGERLGLADRHAAEVTIAETRCVVIRHDQVGQCGMTVLGPIAQTPAVMETLLAADTSVGAGRRRVRPVGWLAWNIARIEAGTPIFNIDFGATNLPHETGVLDDRVSFTKGCYPGQEVVARMQNLGRPKQELVGLRVEGDGLPVAGSQVFELEDGGMGQQLGVVTSSTLSPMLGAESIAFAMVRTSGVTPGATVLVNAEGAQEHATVGALRFWTAEEHGEEGR